MTFLLNPRVLITLALVALLTFTHLSAYRKGKHDIRMEWQASIAQANIEARALENRRQGAVDAASRIAASRSARLAADADRVDSELGRLRLAIQSAKRSAEESKSAADQYRTTCGELLQESGELLARISKKADGHASDVRLLLDSWPKE